MRSVKYEYGSGLKESTYNFSLLSRWSDFISLNGASRS